MSSPAADEGGEMRRSKWMLLIVAVAFLTTACAAEVTGGGFIRSRSSATVKASFGFDLTCNTTVLPHLLTGTWVYHDKSPGTGFSHATSVKAVNVAGTLTAADLVECLPLTNVGGSNVWALPYTTQGGVCKSGCSGTAIIAGDDGNNGGTALSKLDSLGIYLLGGYFAGYSNGPPLICAPLCVPTPRPLLGGNLTITPTAS
jgi:hypothetical protein